MNTLLIKLQLATIDTALSGAVTDVSSFWDTVKAVVIVVVVFGIGLALAKSLKKK